MLVEVLRSCKHIAMLLDYDQLAMRLSGMKSSGYTLRLPGQLTCAPADVGCIVIFDQDLLLRVNRQSQPHQDPSET